MTGQSLRDLATALIALPDEAHINTTYKLICAGEPNASAMCVVAYQNLLPMMEASVMLAETHPKSPRTVEALIFFLANAKAEDEVSERRLYWFLYAAMLLRASVIADKNRQFEAAVAQMWLHIAEGSECIEGALEHNILWSDNEKAWFSTAANGRGYCLNHVMPKWLLDTPAIKEFAERENIFLASRLLRSPEQPGYLVARGDPHALSRA